MIDFALLTDEEESPKDLNGFAPLESEGELQVSSMFSSEAANSNHLDSLVSFGSLLLLLLLFRIPSSAHQEDADDGYDQQKILVKNKS